MANVPETIINIDPNPDGTDANNSQTSVKDESGTLQADAYLSTTTMVRNATVTTDNEENNNNNGFQETIKSKSTSLGEADQVRIVEQVPLNDYRPAPFSTIEEYKSKMQEDIEAGRAGDRWFFEINAEDENKCFGQRSKLPAIASVNLNDDIEHLYFNSALIGIYNTIICLLLEDGFDLIDEIQLSYSTWRVPKTMWATIKEQSSGSPVFVRLLMAQQVELADYGMIIRIRTHGKKETPLGVHLCYIEFIQGACADSLFGMN
ncbi:hypothetical protein BGW38_000196 [Lunasporangiospora selenospora]|uniref:Uncharacterized protein n=1 Tax=Lunasporangiospora selenospora TaxID=979761 RepID=A0A9P6KF50_9FUNG|nr:hypothetical protein BGW38_000196 [Lunasporangiospora selenospora]